MSKGGLARIEGLPVARVRPSVLTGLAKALKANPEELMAQPEMDPIVSAAQERMTGSGQQHLLRVACLAFLSLSVDRQREIEAAAMNTDREKSADTAARAMKGARLVRPKQPGPIVSYPRAAAATTGKGPEVDETPKKPTKPKGRS